MARSFSKMALGCAALAISLPPGASFAQQPPAPAAPAAIPQLMPFDIPYGESIGLDTARSLIAAAEGEAKRHDWKMNIAVVDPHGDLLAFERMDGAQYASISISQNKARTAARWRRDTAVFFKTYEMGRTFYGTLDPQLAASPGGIPLVKDGHVVGAIGCSGGTGDQDALVCRAGVDALR